MSRIEAGIATQVADLSRPPQASADSRNQTEQALISQAESPSDSAAPVTAAEIRAVAQHLQKVIQSESGKELAFDVDEEADKQLFMKVTDTKTGEVIRQIPGPEVRKLRSRLNESLSLFLDKLA
jgi:flagellar protein FlaG